jgi:hypothetical protein
VRFRGNEVDCTIAREMTVTASKVADALAPVDGRAAAGAKT